jgi:hypothetical protein
MIASAGRIIAAWRIRNHTFSLIAIAETFVRENARLARSQEQHNRVSRISTDPIG